MWEYKWIESEDRAGLTALLESCEVLSLRGWELINVTFEAEYAYAEVVTGCWVAILKRKKSS